MGNWMSAAMVVVLAGCGVEQSPIEQPGPAPQAEQPTVQLVTAAPAKAEAPASHLRPDLVAGPKLSTRENVDVTVQLSEASVPEGAQLRVVVGQMGCGFSPLASGSAWVNAGAASVRLPNLPAHLEQLTFFVFRDLDADGQCTAADTVWQGELDTGGVNSQVSLDLSKLAPAADWACFAFNP